MNYLQHVPVNKITKLRWPTTVAAKRNAHFKFKALTTNSNHSLQIKNHSQQIQIAHSKLQIHHSKLQIVHIKFKSFRSNTNTVGVRERLWTADCGLRTADCGLRTADCGLRTADCGLRTADCGLQTGRE